MPVSDVLHRIQPAWADRPTNQQIADMALEQDQAARRIVREGGDLLELANALNERDALCAALSR